MYIEILLAAQGEKANSSERKGWQLSREITAWPREKRNLTPSERK